MYRFGKLIYQQEEGERYGFSLCRIDNAGTRDQTYDLLGVIRVAVDPRQPEKLGENLRGWAVATLAAGGHGFGCYHAAFSTLDEDDQPESDLGNLDINWSGSEVLVPAAE
ncbi:hypothetical protein ACN27J_20355 [Solwaraspora sp. WMMB762]|uniref:hypothetical protein n=1 Tax=unclassified Solwaraspora TaxID=2627926 RepID=UPI00249A7EE9|nr:MULTISPECIES: hypothetical protein [unclassified Solwaraspora]WFE22632.1 hypothetical protein O7621_04600 [Solwaraspora sp. WMMD937]WJK41572.1 hypothetical protein O7608_03855 [Solwaraspora sp. WMMA2056]